MDKVSVGFLIETLGNDPLSKSLITFLNEKLKADSEIDVIVYVDYHSPCDVVPLFGVMNMTDCQGHMGPVVTFSLKYIPLLQTIFNRKYFYVLGLEYKQFSLDEQFLQSAYKNKQIGLIASTDDIAKSLKKEFNTKIYKVLPNLQIFDTIKEDCKNDRFNFSLAL